MTDSKPKPVITIIDRDDSRRNAMLEAFREIATRQYAYRPGGSTLFFGNGENDEKLEKLEPSLIILKHLRDSDIAEDLEADLRVYYGGNGGNDPDFKGGGGEIIWREIASGSNALTKGEAKRLIEYAEAQKDAKAENPPDKIRPIFLDPPKRFPLLLALTILCQSYIVVCAADAKRAYSDAEPFIKALQYKSTNPESTDQTLHLFINQTLAKHRREVQSQIWWCQPFTSEYGGKALSDFEFSRFEGDVKTEWNGLRGTDNHWSAVKNLLDCLNIKQNR